MANGSNGGKKPGFRLRQERELASLARELRRQAVAAKAVLLVADALNLTAGDLLSHTATAYQTALRKISVGKLGDVARAASMTDRPEPTQAGRTRGLSLSDVARFVLDRSGPGSKLHLVERAVVECAMSACAGNQSAAARLLGIERKALARRLARAPRGQGG